MGGLGGLAFKADLTSYSLALGILPSDIIFENKGEGSLTKGLVVDLAGSALVEEKDWGTVMYEGGPLYPSGI